jgi:DNA polymerase-3 subunit delta
MITGSDRPKVGRAIRRLRDRFGEDALEHLTAFEASGDDVVAACNAMGLFAGDGRLVLVDAVERWKAGDAKAVVEYISAPSPETVLVLVGTELKRDSALGKAVAKAGEVLVFDASKHKLPGWVAEQFKLMGSQADGGACRMLVELVGEDLDELSSEVQKLTTWAAGEPITARDVELLAAGRAETTIFKLTDAWGRRERAAALAAAESLLEQGNDANRLSSQLASHVGRVAQCQRWIAEGVSSRDAASKMRRAPYYVQKLYSQAGNFSSDELRGMTVRLADLDHALKGGSRLPSDLELERAVADITFAESAVTAA